LKASKPLSDNDFKGGGEVKKLVARVC